MEQVSVACSQMSPWTGPPRLPLPGASASTPQGAPGIKRVAEGQGPSYIQASFSSRRNRRLSRLTTRTVASVCRGNWNQSCFWASFPCLQTGLLGEIYRWNRIFGTSEVLIRATGSGWAEGATGREGEATGALEPFVAVNNLKAAWDKTATVVVRNL